MIFEKLASAIRNDVASGLLGYHTNMSMSMEQLLDDIIHERLLIIRELWLKGILPIKDLLLSINCVPVDCKDLERCSKCLVGIDNTFKTPTAHFEIPQLLLDIGDLAIAYIGTTDRMTQFRHSFSLGNWNVYNKYRKRNRDKPYVLIDPTPNENGMNDGFIFNAPLIKLISITAVFKDPRQLEAYGCCTEFGDDNFSFINNEIKRRLTEKKIRYYRQFAAPVEPNDQRYQEA